MRRMHIRWKLVVGVLAAMLLVIQAVPYGRARSNPPVLAEPSWDSPETKVLAQRACYDCHSNETEWPLYSRIAPMSWLVVHDVNEGRSKLNFSEWNRPQEEAGEASEVVADGEMPMEIYTLMHRSARLTESERAALAKGLANLPEVR